METRLYHTVATIFRLVAASFKHLNDVLGLACVAGVKRGRASRPYSLPLPFRTPATQAMLGLKSLLRIVPCSITLSSQRGGKGMGWGWVWTAFSSYNAQYQPFHLRGDKANSSLAKFI